MYIALSLVGVMFLTAQCSSRAVRENDRQYPVEALLYQPIKQERQLQRVSSALEQYEYQYEPAGNYPQETQYQPNYSGGRSGSHISRQKQTKQLPAVEQYLKEVTPTTKTAYDPTSFKNAEESKRIQYDYRAESQQQPLYQQHIQEPPKGAPVASNILAYHNALLAQQNAIYEQQRVDQLIKQQNANSNSAIYSQKIEKSPPVEKVAKTSSLNDEIQYYTKLQYEQQHIKQENEMFHRKQAAIPIKYETTIPQNTKSGALATDEEQEFVYQPQVQYDAPTRYVNPSSTPKEQVYLSDVKYQRQQIYHPAAENEEERYYVQPQLIQYRLQPVGATYAENQKHVGYQEPTRKQVQQNEGPSEEALQAFRENIVKYHSIQAGKPTKTSQPVQVEYIPEQTERPQKYQDQQYTEPEQTQQRQSPAYLGPTEEEYRQSQFKQSLGRNSSLRVLKTGKPVVFVGHEE